CLLLAAGCGAARSGLALANSSPSPSTTTPASTGTPTSAATSTPPTPTPAAKPHCPRLPTAPPGQPPAAPLSLYASRARSDNSGSLSALNPSDGSTRWQVTIDKNGYYISSVVVSQNIVYVVTAAAAISALNASDGKLRWCVAAEGQLLSAPNTD